MALNIVGNRIGKPFRLRAVLLASTALVAAAVIAASGAARAQDATWLANPGSGNFYDANNWSPASVPTGTATFGTSATTALTLGSAGSIGGWTFNAGASNYTFDMTSATTFTGAGIAITGGGATITVVDNALTFTNSSSAGNATINYANTSFFSPNSYFRNSSTAGNATINITGLNRLFFVNTSTAGNANINIATSSGGILLDNTATLGNSAVANNGYIYFETSTSAGNATIINSGTYIFFYNSSTAGSATITNNTSLNFWSDASAGSAHITNAATGTIEIVNSSTLANATVINNGQMNFWGGNPGDLPTAGNATIANNTGATMDLRNSATLGNAVITNAGTIVFNSSSTAGNAQIVNNNQLTFYGNTSAGSANISNSGNILFDGNSTADSARLTNTAPGAVINFFTPGPASDGKISAGSIAGAGRFDLNDSELTVGSNNLSTTVTGVLTGTGNTSGTSLIKTGTGTLTLSGTNTYTGGTIINDGALVVNGSIAASSSLTMKNGTTLGGIGQLPTTIINSGATLAPGNSIGTITVNGNLTFNAGTTYAVELSPAAADRTDVTGTATLSGATVQALALPGSFRGKSYTILNATGGLGGSQFDGLTFSGSSINPGARNPHLTYDANNVYLVLDPGTLELSSGASGNQSNVASGINNAVLNGGTPPAAFDALLNMSGAQQGNALDQVSGQPGAASTQSAFDAMQQFLTMLGGSAGNDEGGATSFAEDEALGYAAAGKRDDKSREAYAAVTPRDRRGVMFERRWGVWASGYGGSTTVNGNATSGTSTTTSRLYGTVAGADYRVTPDTRVGFALGGAGFDFSLANGLGSGKADLFQMGLYGRHNFGAAYVAASLAYGWQDVTTDRTVTVAGTDKLTANFKASTLAGRVETGWRFVPSPMAGIGVTPYAALQVTSFRLPGYSETATSGSSAFALAYTAQTTTNARTELGARLDKAYLVRDGLFAWRGRLAWARDSNTDRPVTATFQALPGSSFTVNGAQPAADAALVSVGAEMKWRNGVALAGSFDGEFSSTTRSYAGKATLRYAW